MSSLPPASTRARTKIVATAGPACRDPKQLAALFAAGADVFRLNMAHASLEVHEATLRAIRDLERRDGVPIAVLVDLAGPKIRLGQLAGDAVACREGETIRFVRGGEATDPDELVSNYPKLIDELHVDDRVMLADGTIGLVVESLTRDSASCRVAQGGIVRSRQGINLPGAKLTLPAMSNDDREHAVWAARHGIDFISLSFVRSAAEVRELKAMIRAEGSAAKVVAKIEKQEALDDMPAIVAAADAVMVARGDLGVEIDVARMPVVQKEIIDLCNEHKRPVIVATQMLDSMQRSKLPTRAEVTDVANAILDGCDACMLSGETAVGNYPRESVDMMNRIALATEPLFAGRPLRQPPLKPTDELKPFTRAVVVGAAHMARELDAKLVVVASHSGATALALSKRRSLVTTIGVSDRESTLRQMCLFWGVVPLAGAPTDDGPSLLSHIERWGLADGSLQAGDRIVLVAGTAVMDQGHNSVTVHEVSAASR